MYVRGPAGSDAGFLLDSWLRSYQHAWAVKKIEPWLFYQKHRDIIEGLLRRCTVLVGCDEKAPNVIWGWVCAEVVDSALVIHYAYVKELFRGHGVASALVRMLWEAEVAQGFEPQALVWTHDTKAADHFVAGMRENGTLPPGLPGLYNPYLLREEPESDE